MKKQLRNTLAVALSLLFVFSCFVLPVSAALPDYSADGGYLAIGDSIGRGCGADGSYIYKDGSPTNSNKPGGQYDQYEFRNVEGAYTTLIAQELNCKMPDEMTDQDATFWPLCYPGLTTAMVLDVMGVDDHYEDTALNYPYYDDVLEYFGYDDSFDGVRPEHSKDAVIAEKGEIGKCGSVKDLVEKASLITVEIGMCDVFYRTYRICSNGGMLSENAEFDLSSPEAIATLVGTASAQMYEGYTHWKVYYPFIIDTLLKWNPDATIVMVGSFNLVNELTISEKIPVALGSLFSSFTDMMNKQYKEWYKKYNGKVLYADISNTEPKAAEEDWSLMGEFMDNTFAGTHPSQAGYNYITRQILDVLEGDKEPTTDIIVDIGRYDKVDYVYVDGKQVSDYTVEDYKLTIPYSGTGAKNLTIGIKGEDGAIAVQTYALSYSGGSYNANRVYGTSDIEKTSKPILDLLKSLFQKIIDFFKGLFK